MIGPLQAFATGSFALGAGACIQYGRSVRRLSELVQGSRASHRYIVAHYPFLVPVKAALVHALRRVGWLLERVGSNTLLHLDLFVIDVVNQVLSRVWSVTRILARRIGGGFGRVLLALWRPMSALLSNVTRTLYRAVVTLATHVMVGVRRLRRPVMRVIGVLWAYPEAWWASTTAMLTSVYYLWRVRPEVMARSADFFQRQLAEIQTRLLSSRQTAVSAMSRGLSASRSGTAWVAARWRRVGPTVLVPYHAFVRAYSLSDDRLPILVQLDNPWFAITVYALHLPLSRALVSTEPVDRVDLARSLAGAVPKMLLLPLVVLSSIHGRTFVFSSIQGVLGRAFVRGTHLFAAMSTAAYMLTTVSFARAETQYQLELKAAALDMKRTRTEQIMTFAKAILVRHYAREKPKLTADLKIMVRAGTLTLEQAMKIADESCSV